MEKSLFVPRVERGRSIFRPQARRSVWAEMRRKWYLYAMLLPSLGLLVLFSYYPAALAMIESFYDWKPGISNTFVGLYNYQRVLTDKVFWISWRNILYVALWQFSIPFVIPILVAEAIFNLKSTRAQGVYRVAILIPALVPSIVTLMLWKWLYSSPRGGINLLLDAVGLHDYVRPWLGIPQTALAALLFMSFPWITGTTPLIYLAGLLNMTPEVLDAAKIDGCSTWRRIVSIDLPHLMGQVRLFLIFGVVGLLQDFGRFLALTGGGPGTTTMVPGLYLYKKAFGLDRFERAYTRLGDANAVGVILFFAILLLTYLAYRYARVSGSEYE
ncbi:MAG: sugar ABC transporter permease [Caldilineaceae bacterium]|nr:sugar ABC transporter permease [Caldilineaceae bacterium]